LWTIQSWFLLPIVLLAPPAAVVPRPHAVAVAAVVAAISVLALLAAPVLAWDRHVDGTKHGEAYYRLLADAVTREGHRHSDRPLSIVMGSPVEATTFYSPDHPDAVPDFDLKAAPWVTPARLAREGYVLLCGDPSCIPAIEQRASNAPQALRRDFELS